MAQPQKMAFPAYLVAIALLVIPPIDALLGVLPIRIADPRWRYGALGLESNTLMLFVLGMLIVYMTAVLSDHVRFLRIFGILCLAGAVFWVLVLLLFGLDALQLHSQVPPARQIGYKVATVEGVVKSLLGIATFYGFGMAALRGPKPAKAAAQKRGTGALIMGSKPAAGALPSVVVVEPAADARIDKE